MGEPSLGIPPAERPPEDRLDSWKAIAAYLKRDVTTVQRWEKSARGCRSSAISMTRWGIGFYASRADLDAWARTRNLRAGQEFGNAGASNPSAAPRSALFTLLTRWTLVLPLVAAAIALGVGAILWLHRTEYYSRNPVTDARFQRVTDFDGLEHAAAISRDRHFGGLSVRPGRADGYLGYSGRFGGIPQSDPRNRSRTRESVDPKPRVFARWILCHILGAQPRCSEW